MEHPHHRWLRRLGDDLQDEYENIQADLGGHPEKIQESGHRAETAWIALLLERWLPPNYGIATRRYLLFEQEVDGHDRSGEIDLVIFHPAYPTELRKRAEVMVSGVIAAFNVKLTLRDDGLPEAIEEARLLRRGMQRRSNRVIGDLVSPMVFGLLAQSCSLGQDPRKKIASTVEAASSSSEHPREGLDIVCVADLDCWCRQPIAHKRQTADQDTYSDIWGAAEVFVHPVAEVSGAAQEPVHPVAALISTLWGKLSRRDPRCG